MAASEFGPQGITVTCVLAGPTDTDLLRSTAEPAALGGVAEMAALGWLTGQLMCADGGIT